MTPLALRIVTLVCTLGVLGFTFWWTEINPRVLWEKRGSAVEYLFGRHLTDEDRASARARADRLPGIIAAEQARQQIRALPEAKRPAPGAATNRATDTLAQTILDAMDPSERSRIVDEEYERVLSDKRGGYFPPESDPGNLLAYAKALLETVAIAIWGSLLAVIAAIPASLLAAKTTLELIAPGDSFMHRATRWFAQFVVRRGLDICRGFNEYVMALILVSVIGLGPFAGVLALAIHTFGILGKVFAESIEAIEPGQVEGVAATGARSSQIISFAVIPQIMPYVVSNALLRFETNVRSATILGFCGAGGIGFLMFDKINGYKYREVCTMMIMVIATVSIIDFACTRLLRRFI
jgi:phosphonate transport system permease protein